MRRHLLLGLVLAACGDPTPAPIAIALEDATIAEAAVAIATNGVSIAIAPDATLLAGCARVTLRTAGPVPRAEAARLLARALEASALTMREVPEGWIVDLASGARVPSSCTHYLLTRLLDDMPGGGPTVDTPPPPIDLPAGPPDDPAVAADLAPDDAAIIAGIRAVSETEIAITRAARDALLERSSELTGTVRIVPHQEDGRIVGMRLFGIRAGSAISALGLRNGDVLLTIAGHDLSTPDAALQAYAEASRATDPIPVELRRAGGTLTIRYRIDDDAPRD